MHGSCFLSFSAARALRFGAIKSSLEVGANFEMYLDAAVGVQPQSAVLCYFHITKTSYQLRKNLVQKVDPRWMFDRNLMCLPIMYAHLQSQNIPKLSFAASGSEGSCRTTVHGHLFNATCLLCQDLFIVNLVTQFLAAWNSSEVESGTTKAAKQNHSISFLHITR